MGDIEFNSALITGGAGFIGSHLAEKLVNEGIETKVLDNFMIMSNLSEEAAINASNLTYHMSLEKYDKEANLNMQQMNNCSKILYSKFKNKIIKI